MYSKKIHPVTLKPNLNRRSEANGYRERHILVDDQFRNKSNPIGRYQKFVCVQNVNKSPLFIDAFSTWPKYKNQIFPSPRAIISLNQQPTARSKELDKKKKINLEKLNIRNLFSLHTIFATSFSNYTCIHNKLKFISIKSWYHRTSTRFPYRC